MAHVLLSFGKKYLNLQEGILLSLCNKNVLTIKLVNDMFYLKNRTSFWNTYHYFHLNVKNTKFQHSRFSLVSTAICFSYDIKTASLVGHNVLNWPRMVVAASIIIPRYTCPTDTFLKRSLNLVAPEYVNTYATVNNC